MGRNEHVDQHVKQAPETPRDAQIHPPMACEDVKQHVKRIIPTRTTLERIPESLVEQVSTRLAEVILAQFYTGYTPTLHLVGSWLAGTRALLPAQMQTMCS